MSNCKVCEHPNRADIELALVRRVSGKQISQRFGPSIWSIHRHRHRHMSATLMAALAATGKPTEIDLEALERSEKEGFLMILVTARAHAYRLLEQAEESGDLRAAAALLGRLHENVNTAAKLVGSITTHATHNTTTNVMIAPEWVDIRHGLIRTLAPFPDAKRAVSQFLLDRETLPTLERTDVRP